MNYRCEYTCKIILINLKPKKKINKKVKDERKIKLLLEWKMVPHRHNFYEETKEICGMETRVYKEYCKIAIKLIKVENNKIK